MVDFCSEKQFSFFSVFGQVTRHFSLIFLCVKWKLYPCSRSLFLRMYNKDFLRSSQKKTFLLGVVFVG